MTTQQILDRLADKVGKPLARMAETNYWRCEDHARAELYRPLRDAARRCYADIRNGADPVQALTTLKLVVRTGIECNSISRLIEAIQQSK